MRFLVCGGRDYRDSMRLEAILANRVKRSDLVITGGAGGADGMATGWALRSGIATCIFPAPWDAHEYEGGPRRNQWMIDHGKPDLVIAFPGGAGTADMVRRAREAGIEVVEVEA